MSWTMSSSAMRLVHDCGRLRRRRFAGRHARNGDSKPRAPSQPRFEAQPTAQLLRHQIEDDVQTEPGPAVVATRREERIQRAPLNLLAHSYAVVGHEYVHVVLRVCARLPCFNDDAACSS